MEIILRATVVFFFIWFLMRAMGKRELSQLTAFELVLLITIGDLVQQGVTQEDMSLTGAMLAVGTIALWILAFSYAGYRWKRSRRIVEGSPILVIRDGEVLGEILELERLTREDLMEAAREHGIEDLATVRYGVLEADGRFSFVTGQQQTPPEDRFTK
ncbi:MAG TPA: YetF domain-containing protein [Actinomycetota bacterium]|nr:YetF domain-containing protein [Actinomycetota bacterium]